MKIIIKSEQELKEVAEELIHVLANLRKFTSLWEKSYGAILRVRKKYYENKADDLINRLRVPEHDQPHEIKIKIKDEEI